ncbi:ABC transporter substrate-binding protein [Mesorhizobium sp. LHD-90]|uniref:ABC transporter substrate-binding protein n=1 Tax=Mesorhizobium sp. LHD-90 TaxID=3071414 RepID=UPI0027E07C12|nr:ABC transporter substrate-binding protein [Mesorhizobium sp. LHD-90]MDQ6433199.1 ABC transporter substrate-binding protein [Mesorhizobium sp. LHD-90]
MNIRKLAVQLLVGISLTGLSIAGTLAEPIKIGVIAPLTGAGAQWGMAAAEGVKILAAETNANGGLDIGGEKHQVEVIAYDDKYQAADAVAAYNRLLNIDGAKYVFLVASASTLALKQNLEGDAVLGLTASVTDKAIDEGSNFMYRMLRPPVDYMPPFLDWVRDNVKERRVAIVNPNDETGWSQAQLTERLYKERGFEVLGIELYERAQQDFAPMVTKIQGLNVDIVELGSTSPATAGLIVRQARDLGYPGLFIKVGGTGAEAIVAGAGNEAAEGLVNVIFADRQNEGFRNLATEYEKAVGQQPNEYIVNFYDAANVLVQAIQKAGDADDAAKVAAAINDVLPIKSVQGGDLTLRGAGNREIMAPVYVGIIKGGQVAVVAEVK